MEESACVALDVHYKQKLATQRSSYYLAYKTRSTNINFCLSSLLAIEQQKNPNQATQEEAHCDPQQSSWLLPVGKVHREEVGAVREKIAFGETVNLDRHLSHPKAKLSHYQFFWDEGMTEGELVARKARQEPTWLRDSRGSGPFWIWNLLFKARHNPKLMEKTVLVLNSSGVEGS